jgi:hypothetical protein
MSQDLLTQLADYGEYCEQRQGSVAVDEIELITDYVQQPDGSPSPDETTTPAKRKRRIGVVTAVAAAILLVVGVVVVVADRNGGDVVTDPVSSPSVVDDLGYRWSRVPHDEAIFGEAGLTSVTSGGPGLVAVGSVGSGDDEEAGVWTSVDGVTWTRALFDNASSRSVRNICRLSSSSACAGQNRVMESVTAAGPGLVAVGLDGFWVPAEGESRDGYAAVWTSVDGITWLRGIIHPLAFFSAEGGGEGHQRTLSVATAGPGMVVVGADASAAAVRTSPDGFAWSRAPHDDAVFGAVDDPDSGQWMSGVSVGGPGLVAVGADGTAAAVWTSVDGAVWSRVAHDEAVFGGVGEQEMEAVSVGGPGLVAVGADGTAAAVWTSVDGITWSRVAHDEAVFGGAGRQVMESVFVGGPGLVAVGADGTAAAVWTSIDGLTWSRVPHEEAVFGGEGRQKMLSLTAGGPGLVAVGTDASSDRSDAAVWVAVLED